MDDNNGNLRPPVIGVVARTRLGSLYSNPFRDLSLEGPYPLDEQRLLILKDELLEGGGFRKPVAVRAHPWIRGAYELIHDHHLAIAGCLAYGEDHEIDIRVCPFDDRQMLLAWARLALEDGADETIISVVMLQAQRIGMSRQAVHEMVHEFAGPQTELYLAILGAQEAVGASGGPLSEIGSIRLASLVEDGLFVAPLRLERA